MLEPEAAAMAGMVVTVTREVTVAEVAATVMKEVSTTMAELEATVMEEVVTIMEAIPTYNPP